MESKEELEKIVLKHLVTNVNAIELALRRNISIDHFVYKNEVTDKPYHAWIYSLIKKYYEQENCLLTQRVLEQRMKERALKDQDRGLIMVLWEEIQDKEYDHNDYPDLVWGLKEARAMRLTQEMYKVGRDSLVNDGLEKSNTKVRDFLDDITRELSDEVGTLQNLDMTQSHSWFKEQFYQRIQHPELYTGINCGLEEIDSRTFGFMPGQLIVFLALSSGGKSVMLLNAALHAHRQGKKVLYFSFEMDLWQIGLRFMSLAFKVPYFNLKDINHFKQYPDELESLLAKMQGMENEAYFEYNVNMENPTADFVDMEIRKLERTKGKPDIVVIDYVGNMRDDGVSKNAKKYEQEEAAIIKLFTMGRRWGIPVVTAQQINRDYGKEIRKQRQEGKSAQIWQDAASGSQTLMHLAHYVIGIDSDRENQVAVIQGIKMRDAQFQPFVVRIEPEHNGVYALPPEQQEEWKRIKGLTGASGLAPNTNKSDTPVTVDTGDGRTEISWGGGSQIVSPEDLEMEADDWSLDIDSN